jgi:hypothetical protein
MARRGEAVDTTDRGHQRRGRRDVDVRGRHLPLDLIAPDAVARNLAVDVGELAREKVSPRGAAEDRRALVGGTSS